MIYLLLIPRGCGLKFAYIMEDVGGDEDDSSLEKFTHSSFIASSMSSDRVD